MSKKDMLISEEGQKAISLANTQEAKIAEFQADLAGRCACMWSKGKLLQECDYHKEQAQRIAELEVDIVELNQEIVSQNCTCQDGTLDSMAISTNAQAMRFLAEKGLLVIEKEFGRRVIGKWIAKVKK